MTRAKDYLVVSSFAKIERKLAFKIGAEITNPKSKTKIANTVASQFITEAKIKTITGKEWCKNNFE